MQLFREKKSVSDESTWAFIKLACLLNVSYMPADKLEDCFFLCEKDFFFSKDRLKVFCYYYISFIRLINPWLNGLTFI